MFPNVHIIKSILWKKTVFTPLREIKMLKKSFDFLAVKQRNEGTPRGKSQWQWAGDSNHTSFPSDNRERQTPRTDPADLREDELLQKASGSRHHGGMGQ